MTTDQVSGKSRQNRGPSGCLIAILVVGVMIVIAVLCFLGWGVYASRQVEDELAKIRAAGHPTTARELDGFYALPASKPDTTQWWIDANAEFDTEAFSNAATDLPIVGQGGDVPLPGQAWPDRKAVEQLLADYSDSMALLHQAAERGGAARFPIKFEDGIAALLPHLQDMRSGARMLSLEAHVKAHHGDARGAARSIHAIFEMTNALEAEPFVIAQVARVAINGMAVNLTTELLPHVAFSEEDLRMLQDDVRFIRLAEGLKNGLIGDRAIGADLFQNPTSGSRGGTSRKSMVRASNEDLAYYLRIQGELIEATDLGFPEALDVSERIMEDVEQTRSFSIGRWRYYITCLMVTSADVAFRVMAGCDGLNKSLDAAIGVELYRRKNGKLPDKLPGLVPEFLAQVPFDPFDGQPLRYVVKEDGYIIYTLGMNRKDDGGLDDHENGDSVLYVKQ